MSSDEHRATASDERDLGVFIPSHLDDYGLDPYEFRIYSHIARRAGSGVCFEGLKSIARCCLMDIKTVRQKVAVLVEMGMLRCQEQTGKPHHFTLTKQSAWKHPDFLPDCRATHTQKGTTKSGRGTQKGTTKSGTPPLPDQVHPPTRSGTPPLPDQVPKGDPIKVIPIRESQEGKNDRDRAQVVEVEILGAEEPIPFTRNNVALVQPDQLTAGQVSALPANFSKKKKPRRGQTKAEPEFYPEVFRAAWQSYCFLVDRFGADAGCPEEAGKAWDEQIAGGVSVENLAGIGLQAFHEACEYKASLNNGHCTGIPHFSRYLRGSRKHPSPYWQTSLEWKERMKSRPVSPPQTLSYKDRDSIASRNAALDLIRKMNIKYKES